MGSGEEVRKLTFPLPYNYNLGLYFEWIANSYPDRVALIYPNGERYDFASLLKNIKSKAGLLSNLNLRCGDVIAIFNDKSFESISLMLSCIKLGITYTNLDINSPPERLKKILLTATPILVFGNEQSLNAHKKCIDESGILTVDYSSASSCGNIEPHRHQKQLVEQPVGTSIAYIMFTSGSTGFPKAVSISHSSLINFIIWAKNTFCIEPSDRLTSLNPFHFDNSVFDFFASIFNGSSLLLIPESLLKNPIQATRLIRKEKCTIWFSVPSFIIYCLTLKAIAMEKDTSLRLMIFGGEGFPKSPLRQLRKLLTPSTQLVNVYGPTECTCICSVYFAVPNDLISDDLLPLGFIAPNFKFMICNPDGSLVKPGETGELLLGGPNLSLGYYNDIEKTLTSFIQNPSNKTIPDKFYRTGDIVRLDPRTGYLHFSGRIDNQIKRMGFRIELEEIETAIGSLEDIDENAVIAVPHQKNPASSLIIACVVSSLESAYIIKELRNKIPTYMIPDRIRHFATLPKNQNGKINKTHLKQVLTE